MKIIMIFDSCTFDLNTMMDFGESSQLLRGACFGVHENFVSEYAANEQKVQTALQKFIDEVTSQ